MRQAIHGGPESIADRRVAAFQPNNRTSHQSRVEKDDDEEVYKVESKQNDVSHWVLGQLLLIHHNIDVFTVPEGGCKTGQDQQAGKTAHDREQQQFLVQHQHVKALFGECPSIGNAGKHSHQSL
ncbi:hypothetical protein [uncultured Gimesia sp.]|uniref:hypothetical protein n=1 Tax=uncultured Gimesia sp. TaxID=1678688 RepID=UPI002605FD3C|nr:hypothetical protein [uncultured Gimesia sp.]